MNTLVLERKLRDSFLETVLDTFLLMDFDNMFNLIQAKLFKENFKAYASKSNYGFNVVSKFQPR